ncbi:MAG: hypothetical protein DRG33_03700 [Deltaproteobacteria bacterium]|nr:MAG: hypothetical protein DRG33_03700 [Deltaproteobacteria bacterium]
MATFTIFMMAAGLMADVTSERGKGTLQRQLTAPIRTSTLVAGKMGAVFVFGVGEVFVIALLGGLLLRARAPIVPFVLLSLSFVVATTGLLSAVYGLVRREKQASELSSVIVMFSAIVGGAWLPLSSLPAPVRALAPVSVNYWAIKGYHALLFEGAGVGGILPSVIILGVAGVVLALLGSVLLGRSLRRGL